MSRLFPVIIAAVALLPSFALTARADDFAAVAAKSAEKFKTPAGTQYGVAFMRSTGEILVPAAQACLKGQFPIGSTYDVIFIVSASGRVERVVRGAKSSYGVCIASHLRKLHSAAKPPSGSWPVHIRFLHGKVDRKAPEPPFIVVADDAER